MCRAYDGSVFAAATKRSRLVFAGEGEGSVTFCFIEDVIELLLRLLDAARSRSCSLRSGITARSRALLLVGRNGCSVPVSSVDADDVADEAQVNEACSASGLRTRSSGMEEPGSIEGGVLQVRLGRKAWCWLWEPRARRRRQLSRQWFRSSSGRVTELGS